MARASKMRKGVSLVSDRDQGVAPDGLHGRVVPPVPQPLLRRLEALLGERQEIIVALETLALGDGGETRLLRRRLLQVASEQAHLLDELDALARVRGECAAPRPAKPP